MEIEASTLPPELANGAGYDALRTASHRDLSWHPFSSNYISDLPTTVSRKYACADDLAIMHADRDWQAVEGPLGKVKDIAAIGEYLRGSRALKQAVLFRLNVLGKYGLFWSFIVRDTPQALSATTQMRNKFQNPT